MNLTRTFYDGEKFIEVEGMGLGDIQAYILDRFDSLFRHARRKFTDKEISKIRKILENKILTKKEICVIITKCLNEESFCTWEIED